MKGTDQHSTVDAFSTHDPRYLACEQAVIIGVMSIAVSERSELVSSLA